MEPGPSTLTITLTGVVAGHLLTLCCNDTDGDLLTGVTGGGTWAKAIGQNFSLGGGTVDMWYCLSATGGTTVVTLAFTSTVTSGHAQATLVEWNATGVFDQALAVPAVGGSNTAYVPVILPGAGGELLVIEGNFENSVGASPVGWTSDATFKSDASNFADVCYKVASQSVLPQSTSGLWDGAVNNYAAGIMAFATAFSPVWVAAAAARLTQNVYYQAAYKFLAQGYPTAMVYTLASGSLPTGLSFDAHSGIVSGVPTTLGTYTFVITATNTTGSTNQQITMIVGAATGAGDGFKLKSRFMRRSLLLGSS